MLLTLLLAASPSPAPSDDPPRPLESRIAEVTVYPVEALVTRRGRADVVRGVTRLEARALPAGLRDESIRVKASAGATVVGVDVLPASTRTTPSQAVEELRAARSAKEREVRQGKSRVAVLASLEKYLDAIRAEAPRVQGQGLLSGGDPARWDEGFQYLARTLSKNSQDHLEAEARAAALQQELDELDRRLSELQTAPIVPTKTVALELLADAAGVADVEISYLVGDAHWHPTYDVRASADVRTASVLAYGVVTQATGEDWTDVALVLSTAKPERGAQPPAPQPIVLTQARPAPRLGRAARAPAAAPEEKDALDDRADASKLGMWGGPGDSPPPLPRDAEAVTSGISTQLRVPRPEDVPADRRPHRVRIAEVPLALEPIHVAVPKHASRAFVKARPSFDAPFPLLAGAAQVFVGNDFVGRVSLPDAPAGESIDLHLGADPGIVVERTREKADREAPGFLSSRVTWTHAYRIRVKNVSAATGKAVVEIVEPVPVSRDDRIEVELVKATPDFLRGRDEDRERESKGLLKWRLSLAPGEERTIELAYQVSAPEDLEVAGLE